MPETNTIYRAEMADMAVQLTDPYAKLVYNEVCPPIDAGREVGIWRQAEETAWYKDQASKVTKWSVPNVHGTTDTLLPFKIEAFGDGFKLSKADLGQSWLHGYPTAPAWIADAFERTMFLLKKKKEKAFYDFVSDNNNFESAAYFANAAVPWSDTANSDPLSDIMAGKMLLEAGGYDGNAGVINKTTFNWLVQNVSLAESSFVQGLARDGSVNPYLTAEFLKNAFNLEFLWIARGSLKVNSSDPADKSVEPIWGNSMLIFDYNPPAIRSPQQPSWVKQLFWRPDGKGDSVEGWIVNETETEREGGVGTILWEIVNWATFLSHTKRLAYRIDNLY